MRLEALAHIRGYLYLSSPYTKYEAGIDQAHADICLIAGELIKRGLPIYSPIAHSHDISFYADIDPLSHETWLKADKPMMESATALIVAKMQGWQESYGVAEEIHDFETAGKPIYYLDIKTLELSETV
jgi:hypothetical protein